MEPDIFMIWKRAPFFLEIQRSIYSEKVMNEKVNRYVSYYMSNEWQNSHATARLKSFPYSNVQFFQVQDIKQFLTFASKIYRNMSF
ncbi:hypothetical protein SRABI133_00106 [Peribacillus simplex]|uniref:Uncharacterized protein n=1 Tax=Peribacillus simplex TaxID=1478 RepID=A0A9W4KS81_9BACI|nr:hypothetical protein SRABI133_00106 [Peribacillus simplex]